jgi:hypothetical protein
MLTLFVLSIAEADIISTVEFDSTGNYLATGDKGGRVVLFERNELVCLVFFSHLFLALIVTTITHLLHHSITSIFHTIHSVHYIEKGMRVQVLHRIPVA